MSEPTPHVLLDVPYRDPYYDPHGGRGARLVWRDSERFPTPVAAMFSIQGAQDYEPAEFYDHDDLARFCLAVLALVSIRNDNKLRDQIAQIMKVVMQP